MSFLSGFQLNNSSVCSHKLKRLNVVFANLMLSMFSPYTRTFCKKNVTMLFQRNYIDSNIKYLQQTQILKSLYVCNLMVVWHWVSNIWEIGNKSLWQRLNTFQEKLLCCLKEIISKMTEDLSKTKFEENISLGLFPALAS